MSKVNRMETNFYPLSLQSERFSLFRLPYDKERLSELRDAHNDEYSFFRNGDFIYISPDTAKALAEGEEPIEGSLENDIEIVGSIIRHVLFRSFVRMFGYTPLSFYPLRFVSRKHDAITNLLPDDLKDCFGFRRQIEVQIRDLLISGKTAFGAVYNIEYRWFNSVSCARMFEQG